MYVEDAIREKAEKILSTEKNNMNHSLGIRFLILSKDEVKATMPVNEHTVQPMRILHGGASVALAETIMSIGAWLNLDEETRTAVGIEINANHIRSVSEGSMVIGSGKPLHRGAQTHVWEARITTESEKLVSIARCTLALVNIRP